MSLQVENFLGQLGKLFYSTKKTFSSLYWLIVMPKPTWKNTYSSTWESHPSLNEEFHKRLKLKSDWYVDELFIIIILILKVVLFQFYAYFYCLGSEIRWLFTNCYFETNVPYHHGLYHWREIWNCYPLFLKQINGWNKCRHF